MSNVKTVIENIGRLVVRPDAARPHVLENAHLLIEDGTVVATGSDELPSVLLGETKRVDAKGKVVTPGLIDCHTHLVFGGNRAHEFSQRCSGADYEEIARSGGGILATVRATRAASLDGLIKSGTKWLSAMVQHGTVHIEAKTGYGLDVESELKCLAAMAEIERISGIPIEKTLLLLHAVPPEFEGKKESYVSYALDEILPAAAALAESSRPRFADIFFERGYFGEDDARRLALACAVHGLGLKMHVDQLANSLGAALACELGAISADHLEQTEIEGIRAFRNAKTVPVLLPTSVFCLGKGRYPDARTMAQLNLPIAIASDFNPGSSPSMSLPVAMAMACTQMGLSPSQALAGCTLHAAQALGLQRGEGTLEIGSPASFVIWDCSHEQEIPYWLGAPLTLQTWVKGVCKFQKTQDDWPC